MRKGLIVQLIVLAVVVGAVSFVVSFFAIDWLPELASEEGGRIDDVYVLISVICLVIFAVVAAVSIYAVFKFRAKPDDDRDGKPIHGNTALEVVWTAIPTALVITIAVFSAVVLVKNEELPDDYRVIEVTAQQFAWSFTYPELDLTTGTLVVPVGEKVKLEMESRDVIHSFWVPEWRVKQDVVPGTIQRYIVTPTKAGTYPIICAELCGLGHSTMRNEVVVLPPEEFDAWLAEQRQAAEAGGAVAGEQLFATAGCAGCHVLAAAGSEAQVGPNLDNVLAGQSAQVIRESIIDPNAVVSEGYQPDVMPSTFGDQLSDEQLDALVDYLIEATQG